MGFPGGSVVKNPPANGGDMGSIPGLGRSPGERLPTPIFWPGEFYVLYSPWGPKEADTTERLVLSHFTKISEGFILRYVQLTID